MLTVNWRTVYEVQDAFAKLHMHLIANRCDPDGQYYLQCIEDDILAILKGELKPDQPELQDFIAEKD